MEDGKILELFWNRSESAIEETSKQFGKYCYSISYRILGSDEDAEECVNDTWLAAWDSIPPQRPNCLSVFLGKITRNLSLNRYRQQKAKKRGQGQAELALAELEDCVPAPNRVEQVVDEMILTAILETFLRSQSQMKRNIFIRRYWYFSTIREIAVDYGISESKATSLLHRMRKELRVYLEQEGIAL